MQYQPALDGVRAIAVVAVVLFHMAPSRLPGGFTGVDVFFVLSGYLITSLILEGVERGQFSLREFYLKRALRLGPNLIVMLGVVLGAAYWLGLPSLAQESAENGLWVLGCVSNWFILGHFGGYWGGDAAAAPLLHTWSLAVEEQFYLAFPLLLTCLLRKSRFAALVGLCALALGSFGVCLWGTWQDPKAAYYLPHMRMWELLAGACLSGARRLIGSARGGFPLVWHRGADCWGRGLSSAGSGAFRRAANFQAGLPRFQW